MKFAELLLVIVFRVLVAVFFGDVGNRRAFPFEKLGTLYAIPATSVLQPHSEAEIEPGVWVSIEVLINNMRKIRFAICIGVADNIVR